MTLVEDALSSLGVAKECIKSKVGAKTTTVQHIGDIELRKICDVLNQKHLGARVLTSGTAGGEVFQARGFCLQLADPNSTLCRALFAMQCLMFVLAVVLANVAATISYAPFFHMTVIFLGHSLIKQFWNSIWGCRVTVQLLMGVAVIGALMIQSFCNAAVVSLLVSGSEML